MEKTFNDLLKPHQKRFDYHNSQRIYIDKADVLKLMQQVREATIAECYQSVEKSDLIVDAMTKIYYLPTDRIRIEP